MLRSELKIAQPSGIRLKVPGKMNNPLFLRFLSQLPQLELRFLPEGGTFISGITPEAGL